MTDDARLVYSKWRSRKEITKEHPLHCECADCSKRRKLGALLLLPYSGAPDEVKLREISQSHSRNY